ncbi:MAG: C10 family peptidase [Muribaculaceae bacterium]|nr:C10 family peptidase [Muribaculaceae bacterium]
MLTSIRQKLILASFTLFPGFTAGAAILSVEEAKDVAADFFQSSELYRLADRDAFTLVYTATDDALNPVCYVFNAKDGKGFVIVSAEQNTLPVIGYSDTSVWSMDGVPEAAADILSTPVVGVYDGASIARAPHRAASTQKVLDTPTWSQEAPFNNNIPNRRLTGCVGVAVAEIMKYHNYPASRPADLINAGQSTGYNWDTMRMDNHRTGYTIEEADAVATLVADAAIAIGTDFGMSSSSAFEVKVPYALTSMFGYDAGVSYKKRSELDKATWDNIIVAEIDADRPVLYCGQDVSAGHAFVCDGYEMRGNTPYLHINWGWGGSADGYYASDALNPVVSKAHHYNDLMTIVYNIKPATNTLEWSPIHITSDEGQVGLTLDTNDITSGTFTVRAGALKNISNTDFSGKLAVALFDAAGNQKALLNDGSNFSLWALQIRNPLYVDFTCALPSGVSVNDGDVVRLVTQASGDSKWLPVAGDGNVLAPGEMLAKNGQIPYFAINVPASNGDYDIEAADFRVIKGRDYSFKVVPKSADKVITVKANGFILTPDASNNYRLNNVLADQDIKINVQNLADVQSKSVLWLQAGQLQYMLDDNATATITDLTLFGTMNVDDFTFIRERMKVERLDLSQVNIVASGVNPANAIPAKAFRQYNSLKTVILPSNLATLKNGCFMQCNGIESIEIPASVGTWEYNVFAACRNLKEVTVRRATPAWVNWCVFTGTPQTKLTVPVGATAAYQGKEYWCDFKEFVERDFSKETVDTYRVTLQEDKRLNITPLTEGTEVTPGTKYSFTVDCDDSLGDANMEVYANTTRLYADAKGNYTHEVKANTLFHVEFKQPEATTVDKDWKLSGAAGGTGLVTDVVNVPFNRPFNVRVNAIKISDAIYASKFYAMVLTDKNGGIKEFISSIMTNLGSNWNNIVYNFSCQVREASIKEGNEIRLATSYNKKSWTLVEAEGSGITDRISALGNPVVYHNVNMPQSINGGKIEGAVTEIVHGMPLNLKVTPTSPAQRVTLTVNGETKANGVAIANVSIPAVKEDLEIAIQIKDAGAGDYTVLNVQESGLASKLAETFNSMGNVDRVKLIGTILVDEFAAFHGYADKILDLDLSDLTIKGPAMTANSIPTDAFASEQSGRVSILRTIILPQNLERISDNAFRRCGSLQEVTIPASVTYVGSGAFSSCVGLKKIIMKGSTAPGTGSMSPFPADTSGITLEVPRGAETAYKVGYWANIHPDVPVSYNWVKFDPTRVSINEYGPGGILLDFNKVEYTGGDGFSYSMRLPSCSMTSAKRAGVYRPGTAYKFYDNGTEVTFRDGQYASAFSNKNHTIDVVFYYPITFVDGVGDVETEILNLGNRAYNADMSQFLSSGYKTVYKENEEYKVKLTPPADVVLSVKLNTKNLTKRSTADTDPVYEIQTTDIFPDQEGIYTIPALAGDTEVVISGELRIHVEEGEAVSSEILTDIDDEEAAELTELAVTGELTEEALEALHEKFTSVETLDLSGVEGEEIPENAFEGMTNLTSVVLSETVTEIGAGSFKDCENLTTLTLPNVVAIGEGAFEGCNSLTSIIIPSAGTGSAPANAPARVRARVANGTAITAASFEGMNRNCLIYAGGESMTGVEGLNLLVTDKAGWLATADIVLDGDYPFSVPSEFSLGEYTISFTIGVPGSVGTDEYSGWRGIILPFTPTGWEIVGKEYEYDNKRGSKPYFVSFDNEEAEKLTEQNEFVANRPYLASVAAPFEFVPVTFYAKGAVIPITPMTDSIMVKGKNFSLIGSFDGETTIGTCYELNKDGNSFVLPEADKATVRPFGAYLRANNNAGIQKLEIGEHPLWIFDPIAAGPGGTKLYRSGKVELDSETKKAIASSHIYYTVDGSDPSDPANTARREYTGPFNRISDTMTVKAVSQYKNWLSDVVTLDYELKKVNLDYELAQNWNWISHNMEEAVAVADFATPAINRILSQTQETVRDAQLGLIGTLKELNPAETYKVFTDGVTSTNVNGFAFDPSTPVQLQKGWNWIGCPVDDVSLLVSDLLAEFKAEAGDMLVGLEGYVQADAEGTWNGTLTSLAAGGGYMYYSNSDKTLSYSFVPVKDAKDQPAKIVSNAPWAVDIHRYASVMPVTACLVAENGTEVDASEYAVGAFCGDECRGTGVYVNGVVMINVHGNPGDQLSFRFITPDNEEMLSVSELIFDDSQIYSMSAPYAISLEGTTVAVETVSGADFEVVSEDGEISLNGDLSSVESLEVYDLAGHRVAMSTKVNGTRLSASGLEPGVHIIVVRTTDTCLYRKVMVK